MAKKALIMVDLQNDFCEGGSLAVPEGSAAISIANRVQPFFDLIIATQDWHPKDHTSFASNHPGHAIGQSIKLGEISQILWPDHCIQDSEGAQFHPNLNLNHINHIVHKGTDKQIDSYSAFFDNAHLRSTGLAHYLKDHQIDTVYILGLATDYCVKYSVLDALHLGFSVYVIQDGCRAVELSAGDAALAFQEMQIAGAKLINSQDIIN